jgi:hypothetical protein
MRELVAIAVSAVLLGPSLLGAESLGDVAAREKKKREGKAGSGKVITEADLGKRGRGTYNNPDDPSGLPADAPVTDAGAKTGDGTGEKKEKEKTADEVRAEAETKWRDELKAKNDEVTRLKARIAQFENSGAYASPAMAAELEKLRAELKTAEQAVDDLETQRRRAGYGR